MEIFSIGRGKKTKAWALIPAYGVIHGIDDRTQVSVNVVGNNVKTRTHERNNLTVRLPDGRHQILSVPMRLEQTYVGKPIDYFMGARLTADTQGQLVVGPQGLYAIKLHNPDQFVYVSNIKNLYDPLRIIRWVVLFFSYAIFSAALLRLLHVTHASGANGHESAIGMLLVMGLWAIPMIWATRWQLRANAAKRGLDAAWNRIF